MTQLTIYVWIMSNQWNLSATPVYLTHALNGDCFISCLPAVSVVNDAQKSDGLRANRRKKNRALTKCDVCAAQTFAVDRAVLADGRRAKRFFALTAYWSAYRFFLIHITVIYTEMPVQLSRRATDALFIRCVNSLFSDCQTAAVCWCFEAPCGRRDEK